MNRHEKPEYTSALYENDAHPIYPIGNLGINISRNSANALDHIKECEPAALAHQIITDVGESLFMHTGQSDGHTFDDDLVTRYFKLIELLFSLQRDYDKEQSVIIAESEEGYTDC